MTPLGWLAIAITLAVVLASAVPIAQDVADAVSGKPTWLSRLLGPVERVFYRAAGVDPAKEQTWSEYAGAVLVFHVFGLAFVMALQMTQNVLPLNPQGFPAVSWHSSLNTAVSFVTNTNWQGYSGETTMSYLTQMGALTVQNFLSAATGIAVMAALARGFARRKTDAVGNFWADLVRVTLYVLLPLALFVAIVLASQGVVQTFAPYVTAHLVEGGEQSIALGPTASQVAIKMVGSNGGGFFSANSAHPFESPTPFANFVHIWAILALPVACVLAFGHLVGDARQGRSLLVAMAVIWLPLLLAVYAAESTTPPTLAAFGVEADAGNLEGKEVRNGVVQSALFAAATTAVSNGAVNSMHDSYTPLGGLVPMWLMLLGEVVFGGVGAGVYGMIAFAVVAVFVAGLMIGRTPEYLGKKVEAFEMKMASIAILAPSACVLVGAAIAVSIEPGTSSVWNTGAPQGFSEILYAFGSASNNNGSAFAGLGANTLFYNTALAVCMAVGRFGVILPILAIAGSMAAKGSVPQSEGTLPTHTPLFVVLLAGTVVLVGALTFLPALALGPIAQHLLWSAS